MNIWQADGPASIYEKETAVDSDFFTHLKGRADYSIYRYFNDWKSNGLN